MGDFASHGFGVPPELQSGYEYRVSQRYLHCFRGVTRPVACRPVTDWEAAGLGRRVAALAIDWAASLAITSLFLPIGGSLDSSLLTLGIFYVEVTLLTWLMGASFGQVLLRLRVERIDGGRLPLWRVALRTLLICLVVPAVVFDADGRGLHDRLVGSRVIRVSAS